MPSINGIDFNNISSLNGVAWNSVANIGGVSVSHGASCSPLRLGYSDGRRNPPTFACQATPQFYDFDFSSNLLYVSGGCGTTFAVAGFYSDGVTLYRWNGFTIWEEVGACGR